MEVVYLITGKQVTVHTKNKAKMTESYINNGQFCKGYVYYSLLNTLTSTIKLISSWPITSAESCSPESFIFSLAHF